MEHLYNQMPIFDGSNYAYWKARMKSILKSIDERVWLLCENGWTPPMITVNNVTSLKPVSVWIGYERG